MLAYDHLFQVEVDYVVCPAAAVLQYQNKCV